MASGDLATGGNSRVNSSASERLDSTERECPSLDRRRAEASRVQTGEVLVHFRRLSRARAYPWGY